MLYRLILRNLCADILKSADTLAKQNIFTTLAWPTTPQRLPIIYLAAPQDTANSSGAGSPSFDRTTSIHCLAIVSGSSSEEAQHKIEQLNEQIEIGLLTSNDLLSQIVQVSALHTVTELNAENKQFIASATLIFDLDYVETFPLSGPPLTAATGRLDTL